MILATEQDFKMPKIQAVIGNKRRYILLEDYCFEWEEKGNRYRRTVFANVEVCSVTPGKEGCTTDLASVPPFAAPLGFEPAGPSDGGSIIHDDDYFRLGGKNPIGFGPGAFQVLRDGQWVDCDEKYTRMRADKLYRRRCIAGGMSKVGATIEFLALRIGAISIRNGFRWYFS